MSPALYLAVTLAAAGTRDPACACPCARATVGAHPFRRPQPAAFELNRQGRELYRARDFSAARDKYRAALQADPGFAGPRLNLACAYAQEGRFGEAVAEAADLAQRAFVPWAEEIRQAADLAPLTTRPELKTLQAALAAAGRAWGTGLDRALLFIARRAPPVRLPVSGVLHLGLEQEILAWLPAAGGYRQVTAEQGGVLAFVPSRDRTRVDYVRAGRLVREPGRPDRLRALTLRRLELATMVLGPPVAIPQDVEQLQLWALPSGEVAVRMKTATGSVDRLFDGRTLAPGRWPGATGAPAVGLTARGLEHPASERQAAPCRFTAADVFASSRPPAVSVRAPGRTSFLLEAPFGAGLRGLPFP
jgi:hypothetical protein